MRRPPWRTVVAVSGDVVHDWFSGGEQERVLADRVIGLKYIAVAMGIFGAIALVLAVLGIYGLMAYSVGQRVQEFALRMALGAVATDVLFLTLGRALRITGVGVASGLFFSWVVGRLLESHMYGVVSMDVATFALFAGALAAAALVAALVPARRAMKLDPATILKA